MRCHLFDFFAVKCFSLHHQGDEVSAVCFCKLSENHKAPSAAEIHHKAASKSKILLNTRYFDSMTMHTRDLLHNPEDCIVHTRTVTISADRCCKMFLYLTIVFILHKRIALLGREAVEQIDGAVIKDQLEKLQIHLFTLPII